MTTRVAEETDNDLSDNRTGQCSPTGEVTAVTFPPTNLSPADQEKRAADRKKTAPGGGDSISQRYGVFVPYQRAALSLGASASAGGTGASLTTSGAVLVDAAGTMALQSAGNLTGQTEDAMLALSVAGTKAHTPGGVTLFAGGGSAPGDCGAGGVGTPGPSVPPAQGAEKATTAICNVVGIVKIANDGYALDNNPSATETEVALTALKMLADTVDKGIASNVAMVAPNTEAGEGMKTVSKVAQTTSAGVGLTRDIIKAVSSGDVGAGVSAGISALSSVANVFGLSSAALGSGGGPPADIEIRAADNIKNVAGAKIYGNAPENIDWKTATKWSVNAVAGVEFGTTVWGAFAAAKFEIKCGGETNLHCRRFESKAFTAAKVTAKAGPLTIKAPKITLDGPVTNTQKTTVEGDTLLKSKLDVKGDTLLKDDFVAIKRTEMKDTLTVKADGTFKVDMTVRGNGTVQDKLKVSGEAKLG
jgi:phage baseplate assembly protein gpV